MAQKAEKPRKLEPVPKPNEKLFKDRIQAETAAIDELKAKINEIQQKISAVIGGREEYNNEKANMQSRLDAIQKQIDELEDKRKTLFDQIQSKQREGAEIKNSATALRRQIGFSSAEEIDKKIAALELSMMTSTLSLKEEKQLLDDIKKLKNSKPLLSKYQTLEQSASTFDDSSVVPLRAMLEDVRTKLLELRTKKREESAKYKELVEKRQKATAPGRELIEERDRLSKQMNTHFLTRREIQAELNAENQKYQEYLRQVRLEREEKMREERSRRQIEQQRVQLERELERVECELPYEAEVILLQQTISYLSKLILSPSTEENVKQDEIPANDAAEGVLLPKSQREEEFYFAPRNKAKAKSHKANKEKSKTIKYDVGTLAYFEQCGVAAPVLLDEVPLCIEKLQNKVNEYKEKQADVLKKVDSRKAEILAKIQALDDRAASQSPQAAKNDGDSSEAGTPENDAEDDE